MDAKFNPRTGVLSTILLLAACPLLAQITPAQRLTDAFALEMEGKAAQATIGLQGALEFRLSGRSRLR